MATYRFPEWSICFFRDRPGNNSDVEESFNNSDVKLLRNILAICIFLKRFRMTYFGLRSEALFF